MSVFADQAEEPGVVAGARAEFQYSVTRLGVSCSSIIATMLGWEAHLIAVPSGDSLVLTGVSA
ncbi:hypothetical protein OHR68_13740 [Spirillospora sp. NBC_00431]